MSFNLEAGAVVYVTFTAGYASKYSSPSTLNINSTGTKTLSFNSYIGSYGNPEASSVYASTLLCYTGDTYIGGIVRRNTTAHYSDSA